jgi:hypothetical protein
MSFTYKKYTLCSYLQDPWYPTEIALLEAIIDKLPDADKTYVSTQHYHSRISAPSSGTTVLSIDDSNNIVASQLGEGLLYVNASNVVGVTGFGSGGGGSGATGLRGLTGSQGYTGVAGVTGFQGSLGTMGFTGSQGATGLPGIGVTGLQNTYLTKVSADQKLINSVINEDATTAIITNKKLLVLSNSTKPGTSDSSTQLIVKADSTVDMHFLSDAVGANQTIFFGVTGSEYNGSIAYANSTNQMILRAGGIGATVETLYSDRMEIAADVDIYVPDLSRINFSNSNAAPKSAIYRGTNVLNISNTTDAILISANTTASLKAKTIASMDIDDAGCQFAIIRGEPVGGGSGGKVGFYSHATTALQTVVGAKGGYTGIVNLTTALANLGLITDGTA